MLFSQDGVDCLQKVFSALRRAEKGRQFVTSLDSRLDFISSGQAVICSVIEHPLAEILTCSTSEMSFLVFLLTPILCGQSHTQQSPRHLREKSSLMSHIRRNLVICCEVIISRTEARTSVLLKFVIYYTCIGHRPDLKGISWDHVTESEGIFFFRRYRDPVGTSLQSSKDFFLFLQTENGPQERQINNVFAIGVWCCWWNPVFVKTYHFLLLLGPLLANKDHCCFEH